MKQLILLVVVIVALAACTATPAATPSAATSAPATTAPKTPQALQPTPVSDALFQVTKPDGSSVGFTWDDLKKMPLAQITVDGKTEEGVKLSDVLAAAGVTEFNSVELTGTSSPATLTKGQVDDNTIFDFTNHGTVKLATTYVPKADWTKDVSQITVK